MLKRAGIFNGERVRDSMYRYRISKYNPDFRDSNGIYLRDDWTAVSDIGKSFNAETLYIHTYKQVEDNYVNAIYVIMQQTQIPFLSVQNVVPSFPLKRFQELTKPYQELYTESILQVYMSVTTINRIEKEQVGDFLRLMLREDIGAQVFFEDKLEIFIGYDFLMGVNSSNCLDDAVPSIERTGLFVEKF